MSTNQRKLYERIYMHAWSKANQCVTADRLLIKQSVIKLFDTIVKIDMYNVQYHAVDIVTQ